LPKPTDRELLRLVREHLDLDALLAAHPEVARQDLEALWRRLGLREPAPPITQQGDLFDGADSPRRRSGRSLSLVARCDGAARGNPGPAAIGAVLEDADGDALLDISERIGRATNNVAEYTAVIRAIEQALALGATELTLLIDSEFLVYQLQGSYKVRAAHLRPLYQRAMGLLARLERWEARFVPREENAAADRLANLALDGRPPGP
jgi:ribonuclease HI